jgi:hypothetical protein
MKNTTVEPKIPVYSNFNDIINPPDSFKIIYVLKTFNNYYASVIFESDAVWKIYRINAPGDHFNEISVIRTANKTAKKPYLFIKQFRQDTLKAGFKSGINYSFIAKKIKGIKNVRLILNFEKISDTYNSSNNIDIVIDGSQ